MPKTTKEEIERQLKEKISSHNIKDDANIDLRGKGIFDVIVTAKDVLNIKRSMHLVRKAETIETAKQYMLESPMVHYFEFPTEDISDAFIVLTNEAMLELLKSYGPECVMIDSTHKTNSYGLSLTTVQIRRGNSRHFNVAFCISKGKDANTWKKFFSKILPGGMSTNIFMSDMDNSYFNAWVDVVGPVTSKRVCEWHIHKN